LKVEDYLGNLEAKEIKDDMVITDLDFSVKNFSFLGAENLDEDYQDFPEGKIGFSNVNEFGNKYSLLENLYNSKKIPKKLFVLEYDKSKKHGSISFDETNIINKNLPEKNWGKCNITYFEDLNDDLKDSWTCELSHIYFETKNKKLNLTKAIEQDSSRIIFDSSYDLIGISMNNFDKVYDGYINKNFEKKCQKLKDKKEVYFICDLTQDEILNAESLYFIIQGYIIEIPSSELFFKSNVSKNRYLLGLRFFEENKENSNLWILGKIFLMNMLLVFDSNNQEIRFYKENLINITEEWMNWYNSDFYSLLFTRNFYNSIVAGVIIAVFMLFVCFICCRRSVLRKRNEHGPLIENEIQ
jgi:hypothetical protein